MKLTRHPLVAPLLLMDPERAHALSLMALKRGAGRIFGPGEPVTSPRLRTEVAGIGFANPLGMAAGYDKNAEVPDALLALGFGFVEVGSLTPKPQPGNPRPRVFRMTAERGVVNRLGFNNDGHAAALSRLKRRDERRGIVGVNVGANKDAADRVADYVRGIATFAPHASYLTVNVSSPNTPGLRQLQHGAELDDLLARSIAARDTAIEGTGRTLPLFLKIAPDLSDDDLDDLAATVDRRGVDGMIVSNTTLSRAGVVDASTAAEAGGLSGRPLFVRATVILARMRQRLGPERPIIGVGGVHDAESLIEKIAAGADLVQLYSAMVFEGPRMPARLLREVDRRLQRTGESVRSIRGRRTAEWASRPLPG